MLSVSHHFLQEVALPHFPGNLGRIKLHRRVQNSPHLEERTIVSRSSSSNDNSLSVMRFACFAVKALLVEKAAHLEVLGEARTIGWLVKALGIRGVTKSKSQQILANFRGHFCHGQLKPGLAL